jgi:hypothetical protein
MPEKLKISGIFNLNRMEDKKDNIVKIKFNSIYWNLQAIEDEEEKTGKKLVRLEWGWGAGLTDEERIEAEEDNSPAGYETVTTTLDGAAMLVVELMKIIEKNKDESALTKYIVDYIEGKQPKD